MASSVASREWNHRYDIIDRFKVRTCFDCGVKQKRGPTNKWLYLAPNTTEWTPDRPHCKPKTYRAR